VSLSLTPHNATAGDLGKLPGQYSCFLCVHATIHLLLSQHSPQLWAWNDATRDAVATEQGSAARRSASRCSTRSWTSASTRYARSSDTAALLMVNIAAIDLILSNL